MPIIFVSLVEAGAPGTPNVDDITKNSATISWTKPRDDGGSKIQGYVVEKKKLGEDWMECLEVKNSFRMEKKLYNK